jgi:hypothetical protein
MYTLVTEITCPVCSWTRELVRGFAIQNRGSKANYESYVAGKTDDAPTVTCKCCGAKLSLYPLAVIEDA